MTLYIVQMYRYGDEGSHSYIEGVYDTWEEAEKHGEAEDIHRGGKYNMTIYTHRLNEPRKMKYMSIEELKKRHAEIKDTE